MKTLYLVRHGVAVPPGTPEIADDDRELTKRGERKVEQIGRGLLQLRLKLSAIVTSPLPRARKTAEILACELGLEDRLVLEETLGASSTAAGIHEWLKTQTHQHLMIVGHNPSFSNLIGLLLGAGPASLQVELRKGGIAAFSQTQDDRYHLDWLARPRLIRSLAKAAGHNHD